METQKELSIGIGNEESEALKPAMVKIEAVEIVEVGEKHSKKVVFACKHPDKEEPIKISSVKYERAGKLEIIGTWFNLDSKGMIRKGGALATVLVYLSCNDLNECVGKELSTLLDDGGFLCFKAY